MEIDFYNEAQKVWKNLTQNGILKDNQFELQLHKKLLEIFQVGNFYYWFFDITSFKFLFLSPEIKKVLGYDAENIDLEFFMSKIHPDDQSTFLNHENMVLDFFNKLPVDKILKYKVSYDYRMINSIGQAVRILHEVVVIQHDENKVLMTLGVHTDISHFKTSNVSKLSFIGMEGEPSYNNVSISKKFKSANDIFTKREKEVIQLITNGFSSVEIAKKLFISKHTVDSHRKKALLKTNTKNIPELITKIINDGII